MLHFFRKTRVQTAKPSLDGIELYVKDIPGAVHVVENVPRVEWGKVWEAVKPYQGHPAIELLWTELAAQWLGILRKHFGDAYQLYENEHLLMLSGQETGAAKHLLNVALRAYKQLEAMLPRTPEERGPGKHVVIVFTAQEHYYDYISYFFPERDRKYGTSGGMHIHRGYHHTVLNGPSHRTLVHELAHNAVTHRPLPRWLNEGLAQTMEDMLPGDHSVRINARQKRVYRRYWSWVGIHSFWDGSAFSGAGSQGPSYMVSKVLFQNLMNDPVRRKRLAEFIAKAHRKDSGAAACQECFGCSLGSLVEGFLGEGDWERREEKALQGDKQGA